MKTRLFLAVCFLLATVVLRPAFAGCGITIKAENKSLKEIHIQLPYSEVRTRVGTWAGLMFGQRGCQGVGDDYERWIFKPKTGYQSITCELDFGCNADRRYRFRLFYSGNAIYEYYPSDDEFTERTTIDLGNIGRHFKDYE
ncbi:MAG: hypothetical protein ACREVE_12335 [Gammaproteobacteria bacterium]